MSKLKIKPSYPITPSLGLLDWKFLLTGRYFDFLDDTAAFPSWESSLKYPRPQEAADAGIQSAIKYLEQGGSNDWEDIATNYRAKRDWYLKGMNEYYLARIEQVPFDMSVPYQVGEIRPHYNAPDSEVFRFNMPSLDGTSMIPDNWDTYLLGLDFYAFHNINQPLKTLKVKYTPSFSLKDVYNCVDFQASYGIGTRHIAEVDPSVIWAVMYPQPNTRPGHYSNYGAKYRHNHEIIKDMITMHISQKMRQGNNGIDEYVQSEWGESAGITTEAELLTYYSNLKNVLGTVNFFEQENSFDSVELKSSLEFLIQNGNYRYQYPIRNVEHTALPVEIFGENTTMNHLPLAGTFAEISLIEGNIGDTIRCYETGQYYAWDHINGEWSNAFYLRFFDDVATWIRVNRDALLKAVNEVLLSIKPFTWAAHHLPALSMFSGIKNTSDKVVPSFASLYASLHIPGPGLVLPTTLQPGDNISVGIGTSTGYIKVTYWDGTSEILGNGNPDNKDFSYSIYFSKDVAIDDTYSDRSISVISCNSEGVQKGNILTVSLDNAKISNPDISGLTKLLAASISVPFTCSNILPQLVTAYISQQQSAELDLSIFPNIQMAMISSCPDLVTIDASNLQQLTQFFVRYNPILTSVDLSGSNSLFYTQFETNNSLSSIIGISTGTILPNVQNLTVKQCNFTTPLNLSGMSNLNEIHVSGMDFYDPNTGQWSTVPAPIDVDNLPSGLSNIDLTTVVDNYLDFSRFSNLSNLNVNSSSAETIDLGAFNGQMITIGNNDQLTNLITSDMVSVGSMFHVSNNDLLSSLDVQSIASAHNNSNFRLEYNPIPSSVIDDLLIAFDNAGKTGKSFFTDRSRTSNSNTAKANLISKGWSLYGPTGIMQ